MKFEDLTNEQIEKAKACETLEEKIAFLKEYNIEIPDDMLDEINGGSFKKGGGGSECPMANGMNGGSHKWEKTGAQRPGSIWKNVWKDSEYRCIYCGKLEWWKFS